MALSLNPFGAPLGAGGGGEDHGPSLSAPRRGSQLGLLLDTLNAKYDFGEEKYSSFVSITDTAIRDMRSSGILNVLFSSEMDRSRHSLDDPAKAPAKDEEKNSSLLLAFMFYAAMQVAGTASFSATQLANETMTLYELDKFCRDFKIIPNMLSKHEIKALWSVYGVAYQQKYRQPLQAMTFIDFQDFFVRMALYTYNKCGMRRMIVAVIGHFPPPEQLVSYFCSYCHFHDYSKVKTIIRTVGKTTQGAINFRSNNEANTRAREEQIIDLRTKALLRQTQKEMKLKEAEFNKKKEERCRREIEERERRALSGVTEAKSSSSVATGDELKETEHKHKKLSKKAEMREQLRQQAVRSSSLPIEVLGLIEPEVVKKMTLEREQSAPLVPLLPHTHRSQVDPALPFDLEGLRSSGSAADDDDDDDVFHAEDDMTVRN